MGGKPSKRTGGNGVITVKVSPCRVAVDELEACCAAYHVHSSQDIETVKREVRAIVSWLVYVVVCDVVKQRRSGRCAITRHGLHLALQNAARSICSTPAALTR